jgi:NAD(P)-dependent dehydrogenase (short-subunit alcohol dehydrogenase family)
MSLLQGRSAIITGASQGLGRALALAFAKAGANLLLTARGADALQQTERASAALASSSAGQIVCSLTGDVSRTEDCQEWVEEALRRFGQVDILINNAGIYGPIGRIEENDWNEWLQALQINLLGTVQMCRAVLPHMRERKYGKIINLSGGGATAPLPNFSSYAASKAAVVRFTETLAAEARDDHIDVNSVAPGALNTRLLEQVLAAGPARAGLQFYERSLQQRDSGGASLERAAELVVYLASARSDGITGRLLSAVWDDWETLHERRQQLAGSDVFTLRRIVPEDRQEQWKCA